MSNNKDVVVEHDGFSHAAGLPCAECDCEIVVVPYWVTLYHEQTATLRVLAPEGTSENVLTELALRELDDSGGAEWETNYGDTTIKEGD